MSFGGKLQNVPKAALFQIARFQDILQKCPEVDSVVPPDSRCLSVGVAKVEAANAADTLLPMTVNQYTQ